MTDEFRRFAMESRGGRPLEVVDVSLVHINPSAGYAQVESFDEADRDLVTKARPHVTRGDSPPPID